MARTTEDSEALLEKEIDKNTEDETREDLREEPASASDGEPDPGSGTARAEESEDGQKAEPEAAAEAADEEKPTERPEAEPEAADKEEPGERPETADEKEPGERPEVKPEAGKEESAERPEAEPESAEKEEPSEKPENKPEKAVQKKAKKKSRRKVQKTAYEDPEDEDLEDEDPEDDESEEGGMGLNLFTLFVLLIAAAVTTVFYTCTVKTVKVTGNHLYTSEEIAARVISDDSQLRHNTVFLTALYMTPKAPTIPFEESVKVSLESYDTIKITVKDMDIAAFIPYAGKYLYFSADGIVLENSPLLVKNATFVTGLNITGAQKGEKMTSDDEAGLSMILEVLQILRKYQIRVESVVLADSGGIVMYMDDIKVFLGRSGFELKISKIAQLLPYLEGRSGTIDLTNYTSADQNIILK